MKNIYQEIKEISGNFDTPITLFLKLRGKGEIFLLESAERMENTGRFSFILRNPLIRVIGKENSVEIIENNKRTMKKEKTMDVVRNIMKNFVLEGKREYFDFGFVGYFAFDLIREHEKLNSIKPDEIGMPTTDIIIPREVVVYDHLYRTITIIVSGYEEDRTNFINQIKKIEEDLDRNLGKEASYDLEDINIEKIVNSNFSKKEFENIVVKAKEYIENGDIFQVVLSQRFSTNYEDDGFQVYKKLRNINPSPYMYYLDYGNYSVCGSSPEALVKVKDSMISTNPIAGTRKRGKDKIEDDKNEIELLSDEKELAEHLMLLDLGRNDLGKVSKFGSINVPRYMGINKFSHVMHISSDVIGELRKDKDIYDGFIGCFPAGTVSGAPKIRAIQIIDELENCKRGVYGGAVGHFSVSGEMDTCIAIRTLIFKDKKVFFQAGAGIVRDSDPECEYFETINKATALLKALGGNYDFTNR